MGTEVMQVLQPSGGLNFHSRFERGLLSRGGTLLWVQSYGLWLEIEPRGLMENLGYSWRYSNMSRVVRREARSSDLLVIILWRHMGLFCRTMAAWVRCGCLRGWFHLQKPRRWGHTQRTTRPAAGSGVDSEHHIHTSLLCLEDTAELGIEAFRHTGPHFQGLSPELLAGCRDSRARKTHNVSWQCSVSLLLPDSQRQRGC